MYVPRHWPLTSSPNRAACGALEPRAWVERGDLPPRSYCRACVEVLRLRPGLWLHYRLRGWAVPSIVVGRDVHRWEGEPFRSVASAAVGG